MLTCDTCQQLMADALYDELDPVRQKRLDRHLQDCQPCRELNEELLSATRLFNSQGLNAQRYDDIPERAHMDELWESMQGELDRVDAERFRRLPRRRITPFLAGAMAMAASLLVFIFIFDVSINTGEPALESTQTASAAPVINQELMNYLSRAQTMLLLVANAESENVSVIPIRQSAARTMAQEANIMTTGMENSFSTGQSLLLKDIEFMLMQIANLDDSNMEEGVRLLQQFMEDNSIFLKIRLLEMRDQGELI